MRANMLIQRPETLLQIVVVVGRQALRMRIESERTQRARKPRHFDVELLRMPALRPAQVAQNGEALVDGVHKPETRNLIRGVSGAALSGSSARARKRSALFVEDVHERSRDVQQPFTRANLQARRNKTRVENKSSGAVAQNAS